MNKKYQGVLAISGYPLKLYHRTTAKVEKFLPFTHFTSKSSAGKGSFNQYTTCQNDTSKSSITSSYLVPAYLFVSNPKALTFSLGGTLTDLRKSFICELLNEQFGKGLNSYISCQENVFRKKRSKITADIFSLFQYKKEYAFIFQQPDTLTSEDILYELRKETIFNNPESNDELLNKKYLVLQRLVRFWEQKGYDGFTYNNGINQAYVTFREQQIKRLDRPLSDWHFIFPSHKKEEELKHIYNKAINDNKKFELSLQELILWEKCLTDIVQKNKPLPIKQSYQNLIINNVNQRG